MREEYDRVRQHVTQAEAHASCSRLHQFLPKLIKSILSEMKSGFHACRSGGCAADFRGGVHLMQKKERCFRKALLSTVPRAFTKNVGQFKPIDGN
jgi:hypothetical protein